MDLESLNKLEENANSTIIGKLEEKLPYLICIESRRSKSSSSAAKLVRSMAYVLHWAGRASRKYLEVKITDIINASEYGDAYNYLIWWDQTRRLDEKKLKKYSDIPIVP